MKREVPDETERNDDLSYRIGSNVRYHRNDMGLTVTEFAELVDITESYVGLIERGARMPSVGVLYSIASVLKISWDELFYDSNSVDSPVLSEDSYNGASRKIDLLNNLLLKLSIDEIDFFILTARFFIDKRKREDVEY